MNKAHRVVWSEARQSYVVAHEKAAFGGRPAAMLALSLALLLGLPAHAAPGAAELPTGGHVVAGSATIGTAGARMDILQTTQRAAIDWNTFNIGSAAHVHFAQPAGGAALNRVLDTNASQIYGRLTSTGQVFLVNPNGVLFAPGAQVDVGGLVASTLNISNADFMAGNYRFEGASSNAIINQGNITAHGDGSGGTIALIAARITNDGNLTANGGNVLLGAGSKVTLDMGGPVKIQVEQGTLDALIEQGGAIRVDGGLVHLSARAANDLVTATINHTGITEASSLTARGGRVVLEADHIEVRNGSRLGATGPAGGGEILVGGGWQGSGDIRQATTVTIAEGATLDASATDHGDGGTVVAWSDVRNADSATRAYGTFLATGGPNGGDGGRIETSGHWLDTQGAQGSAAAPHGKAGEWLFDPYDVTITTANLNGSFSSGTWTPSGNSSTILNTDINTLLEGGTNVTITTGSSGGQLGDITIDAAVTKGSGNTDVTLTMRAANSIVVNQAINNTGGSGKLHVALDADNNNGTRDGAGIVLLNNSIGTGGGNIDFGTGATMSIGGVTTKVGGDVYVGGSGAIALATGGGSVTINGETIIANTSGLSISTSGGNVTFGGLLNSGNTYAGVSYAGTWEQAKTNAASGTGSATGDTYLATITSRLENAVAGRAVNYNPSWLGGRRVTGVGTDSQWRWVTGPEASQDTHGLIFFTQNPSGGGTTVSGLYSNWNSGEPNNWGGGTDLTHEYESVLQFTGSLGNWNDLTGGPTPYVNTPQSLSYYVKETNLASSPLTIDAGAGSVTFSGAVGTSKALASLNVSATGGIAINGGAVTTQGVQTYNNSITLGAVSTTLTQTNANTDFNLLANKSISNATAADATLTVKTTGAIILGNASSISSSTGKLNTVLWSDSDGDASGYIQAGNSGSNATISTNGGHLWMGGGSGSTTWNGLTVGNANAAGNAAAADGIYLYNAGINTNGGNIAMYGEGRNGAAACGAGSSCTADGIKFRGTDSIDSGAGTLYMYGKATSTDQSANGIELGHPGETTHTITSANSTAGAITLEGYAGTTTGADAWGVYTYATTITATGGGGITLKGSGTKNAGVTVASGGAVLANSGNITLQGTGYGATTPYAVLIQGNVGQKAGTSVTASTSNIDIIGDTLSVTGTVQSSGNLVVRPNTAGTTIGIAGGTGTLALPASYFSTNFVNGFSGITVGSATAGNMTIAGATTYSDNLTLKTAGDIVMNAGSSLTGQSGQSASLVFWADSDATDGGRISLNNGSSIATHGGHLWLGGGSGGTTWNELTVGDGYATGASGAADGILINGATLNSAGGDIALHGKSAATDSLTAGIRTNYTNGGFSTLIDSGSGTILLDGINQGTGAVAGVEFNTHNTAASTTITSANTTANAITLNADARPATVAGWGVLSYYGTTISATGSGGGISITGAIDNSGGKAIGFHSPGNTGTRVLANGGPIVFNAITDGAGDSLYAVGNGMAVGQLAGSAVTSSSSNITLNIDRTMAGSVAGVPDLVFNSSGTLTVQPRTAGTTIGIAGGAGTLALPAGCFSTNFVNGFSGITVGKSDAGAITVGGAATFNDSMTLLTNSTIAINGAVTANENLALQSNGAITQSQAVSVTGTTTITAGANDVTLTNASNNFTGAVSVVSAQNLALIDSNAMTLGAVTASGTVDIATLANDLTLTGAVSTTNTSANAVKLNAGKNTAAGTATGGNILVSGGSISTGSGGRATLYSGSVSGSTGLTALIGSGSGNFRYNSDESATNYTTALGTGSYAIYREQPTATITANDQTVTYGTAPTLTTSFSGQNGDTAAQAIDTAATVAVGGGTSTAGHYSAGSHTLTPSGAASGLGYALSYANGMLTVNQKTLTVGYSGVNRVYDGTTDATVTTSDDRVSGDTLTIGRTASFADKNVGTGKTVSVSGVSLSGTDAGNYTVAATGSTTADITARTLAVGYTGVNRVYDGTTDATVTTSDDRVSGDTLTIGRTASFADKNVGTGKTVSVSGVSLGGADAGNYVLASTTGSATADITADMTSLLDPVVNQLIREQLPPQTTVASSQAGEQASTLEMVEVSGKAPNIPAIIDNNNNGLGLMRVFVVDGGIRLPDEMTNMGYGDVRNKENP